MAEDPDLTDRNGGRTDRFADLMAFRVREILLVATKYDAFVLEEDGQLAELVVQEYRNLDLNPRYAPQVTRAASGRDAFRLLGERRFDLVVTTARLADSDLRTFGKQLKASYPDIPLGVLAAHAWELPRLEGLRDEGAADWIFLWQGDVKALYALIKQAEDRRNADHDVLERGVQAIILVEDDLRFCSFLLPHLYAEVTRQTARLVAEGLNISHRLLRLRARPKILLAASYEQAWQLCERYGAHLLGVITDVSLPRAGREDPDAGLALAAAIRTREPDLPVLVQSTEGSAQERAAALGAAFLHKEGPHLLDDLHRYLLEHYGFGDFVFRTRDGAEVGRARNLRELLPRLEQVPDESLDFHARHHHFSRWLLARTEFGLAARLRARQASEFPSTAEMRAYLRRTLAAYLGDMQRHVISDFKAERFDEFVSFARVGSGSLGGKGRGLAFMHQLLADGQVDLPGAGVEVSIPQTVVLASDVFAEYLEGNGLGPRALDPGSRSDQEILDAFRGGRFDSPRRAQLASYLGVVRDPLAVRSSSILEDSLYQPFAGVYATVMLPNNHPSLDVRLAQLLEAIKVVYASTYMKAARDYLEGTPHRLEEEQMAVLLQRLVGSRRGRCFYPILAGVACSYNFYPFGDMRPEQGVAQVALGLGKSVVEGLEAFRFCPARPQILPQFSDVKDVLRNAQRRFWALDMSRDDLVPGANVDSALVQLDALEAVKTGGADLLLSTYFAGNDAISPGLAPGGVPLVTFAPLLRGMVFPFAEVVAAVLGAAERGMGVPVEIEFAVDRVAVDAPRIFHVLQVRPMVVERAAEAGTLEVAPPARAVVVSEHALGHGRDESLFDVVLVKPDCDRGRTVEVAAALDRINKGLRQQGRRCLLIGPGRWGSRDPWLGIPVTWSQVSAAKSIVETDFADLDVEPSQGSHFFHNLTSFGIPFLSVRRRPPSGEVDWPWFASQPAVEEAVGGAVRHLRFAEPLRVRIDGATGRGVIVWP